MSSLFNNEVDWRIGVIRYRDAYFLHVFHTETELNVEFGQSPLEKRMCYWGHKFEDYLCFGLFFSYENVSWKDLLMIFSFRKTTLISISKETLFISQCCEFRSS